MQITILTLFLRGFLSPAVMGLVAYHLASMWLHSSRNRSTANPTPMQYYHVLDLVSNASLMAFLRVIVYSIKQGWSRWKSASLLHTRMSRILLTAFIATFVMLSLDFECLIVGKGFISGRPCEFERVEETSLEDLERDHHLLWEEPGWTDMAAAEMEEGAS